MLDGGKRGLPDKLITRPLSSAFARAFVHKVTTFRSVGCHSSSEQDIVLKWSRISCDIRFLKSSISLLGILLYIDRFD